MELKPIANFEGRYLVSGDGRIFSIMDCTGQECFKEKNQYTDKYGYKCCMLYKNGEKKHTTIHRAVAMAFLPNNNNFPQVNHIDGNKENNNVSNLEWCTVSHNVQHAYDTGLNKPHTSPWKNCESKDHPRAKRVVLIKGNEEREFDCARYASSWLGVSKGAVADAAARGRTCKGWTAKWIQSL